MYSGPGLILATGEPAALPGWVCKGGGHSPGLRRTLGLEWWCLPRFCHGSRPGCQSPLGCRSLGHQPWG